MRAGMSTSMEYGNIGILGAVRLGNLYILSVVVVMIDNSN